MQLALSKWQLFLRQSEAQNGSWRAAGVAVYLGREDRAPGGPSPGRLFKAPGGSCAFAPALLLWEGTFLTGRFSPGNSYAYFNTHLPWPLLFLPP